MILNIVSYFIYIVYICQWKADFLFFILKKQVSSLYLPLCRFVSVSILTI